MITEQTLHKISNTIVNTLILYSKIEMGHKNVWLDGIKELLLVAGDKYTPNAHEKLINFCKQPTPFGSAFGTFESRFKNFITPPMVKIEKNQKTIDDIFNEYTEEEKIKETIGWLKNCPVPLPKCYLDWVKQQDEETKVKIRKYYSRK